MTGRVRRVLWIFALVRPIFPSSADRLLHTDAQDERRALWEMGG